MSTSVEVRESFRVRLSHFVQDRCRIQYHKLMTDGSVRPGLFYTGWKRRVEMACIALEATKRGGPYDTRTFWQRIGCARYGFAVALGFSHLTALRIAGRT